MEIPMLDEKEYKIAENLHRKGFRVLEKMHHRINIYGTDCEKYGKPYRTPKASFCASYGNKRNE